MPPQHSEGLFLEAIQFDTSALEESLKRSAGSELRHRHDGERRVAAFTATWRAWAFTFGLV